MWSAVSFSLSLKRTTTVGHLRVTIHFNFRFALSVIIVLAILWSLIPVFNWVDSTIRLRNFVTCHVSLDPAQLIFHWFRSGTLGEFPSRVALPGDTIVIQNSRLTILKKKKRSSLSKLYSSAPRKYSSSIDRHRNLSSLDHCFLALNWIRWALHILLIVHT